MSDIHLKQLPLQGKRILVTRTRSQASALSEKLRAAGAMPVEFPTIRIEPPQDWSQLDAVLSKLFQKDRVDTYSWLVFTSANGVTICCERMLQLGYLPQEMTGVRVAAIGPATAAALTRYGLHADLVPEEYIAEGVAAALIADAEQRQEMLAGKRILLARAAEARKVLVTLLQEAGALVDEVPAYYTHAVSTDDEQGQEVVRLLQAGQLDIITFTSSSTVRNFMQWLHSCQEQGLFENFQPRFTVACIGPITSQTAREFGLHVDIEAREFTIDGLVEAIIQHEDRA